MMTFLISKTPLNQGIHWLLLICFIFNTAFFGFLPYKQAQAASPAQITVQPPVTNTLVLQGLRLNPSRPFELEFILSNNQNTAATQEEINKTIKYFLAFLTIPDEDLWVNLSPHEQTRIIPNSLGQTKAGQDLLTIDYDLKQLAASLTNPNTRIGKEFWDQVYAKALRLYGTTDVPISTLNKVWFTPGSAIIYEKDNAALISECSLKVYLHTDQSAQSQLAKINALDTPNTSQVSLTADIYKSLVIPVLSNELNHGEAFQKLRQIFHSLILAQWFKHRLQQHIISRIYGNTAKINGISDVEKQTIEHIYSQYIESFKRGAYNFIKEDFDPVTHSTIARKYFSGGFFVGDFNEWAQIRTISYAPDLEYVIGKLTKKLSRATITLKPLNVEFLIKRASENETTTFLSTPKSETSLQSALPAALLTSAGVLLPLSSQAQTSGSSSFVVAEFLTYALQAIQNLVSDPYLLLTLPATIAFVYLFKNILGNRSKAHQNTNGLGSEKIFLKTMTSFLKGRDSTPFLHNIQKSLIPKLFCSLQDIRTQRIGHTIEVALLASTPIITKNNNQHDEITKALKNAFENKDIIIRLDGKELKLTKVGLASRRISLFLDIHHEAAQTQSIEIDYRSDSESHRSVFSRQVDNNQLEELTNFWDDTLNNQNWDTKTVEDLIERINVFRSKNPPDFKKFSEQANMFYRIRELSLITFQRLKSTKSETQHIKYFFMLFKYSNQLRYIMAHCGTLDSYKSHFLEPDDKIFFLKIPNFLAELMRRVFMVHYAFNKSKTRVKESITPLVYYYHQLNSIEYNILRKPVKNLTQDELNNAFNKFSQNLETPAADSIEGPDLTRRHGQIYSFLKYSLGLPGIILAGDQLGKQGEAFIAFASILLHFFYFRYLITFLTPYLINKDFEKNDQSVGKIKIEPVLEHKPSTHEPIQQSVKPDGFKTLLTFWRELLDSNDHLNEKQLRELSEQITSLRKSEPLAYENFRSNLSQYHQIRDLAKETTKRIANQQEFQPYKRFFILWALYSNEVRYSMTRFADLDVLKGKFVPPFSINLLHVTISEPVLKTLRVFFGLSFRYYWAKMDVINSTRTIGHLHRLILTSENTLLKRSSDTQNQTDIEQTLTHSLRENDLKYRYPMSHGLVGRYYYQRIFDVGTLALNLGAIATISAIKVINPQWATLKFMDISLVSTYLLFYMIIYWIRPQQAYIESLRDYSTFKRDIAIMIKRTNGHSRSQWDSARHYFIRAEHFLFGASYLLAFSYPLILPAIMLVQVALVPKNSNGILIDGLTINNSKITANTRTQSSVINEDVLKWIENDEPDITFEETNARETAKIVYVPPDGNDRKFLFFPSAACIFDDDNDSCGNNEVHNPDNSTGVIKSYEPMVNALAIPAQTVEQENPDRKQNDALDELATGDTTSALNLLNKIADFEGFTFSIKKLEPVTNPGNYLNFFFSFSNSITTTSGDV